MRYSDFEEQIRQMAWAASEAARQRFALETMRMLQRSAEAAVRDELSDAERRLLAEILAGIEREPCTDLEAKLEELLESTGRDPVRAIEFHPDLVEFLCAIDHWLGYRRTGDPVCIARIAINLVNSIDHAIGGDAGEYSAHNMLGAPEMREEFQRMQRLLIPG